MIGIGLDVVELDRFRRTLERTPGFVQRVFTAAEQDYAEQRRDPTERYAVRFAAKEAVLKAMGLGLWNCPFTEIEIVRADSGEPSVLLHGEALSLATERDIHEWQLTLTHTDVAAHAIAVAFGPERAARLRLHLPVREIERSVTFYEDVLGFTGTSADTSNTTLVLGAVTLDLELADEAGGIELTLEVPSLEAAHRRASRHHPGLTPLAGPSFTLVDPDGHRVHMRGSQA